MPSVAIKVDEDDLPEPYIERPATRSVSKRKQDLVALLDSEMYSQRHHVGVVGEPYMTPFVLFNLLMREFGCPLVTREEVSTVIQRFESVRQSFFSMGKKPRKRTKKEADTQKSQASASSLYNFSSQQSVLMHASQLYSQSQEVGNGMPALDTDHCSLLDVMSELCASRGLRFTERAAGPREKNQRTLIYPKEVAVRKKAFIIADASRPFFALVLAVPFHLTMSQRNKMRKPKLRAFLPTMEKKEHFMTVLVCTPYSIPFRITVRGKPIPVTNAQVILAQIELPDKDADGPDNGRQPHAVDEKMESTTATGKRARDVLGDDSCNNNNSEGHEPSKHLLPEQVSEDRFFYVYQGKRYLKFGKYPIFTEQDQTEPDPFFQIRPSPPVSRSKKPWTERIRGMRRTRGKLRRLK